MIGSWVELWVDSVPVRGFIAVFKTAKLLRRLPRVVRVTDPQAEAKAGTVSPNYDHRGFQPIRRSTSGRRPSLPRSCGE